MASTSHHLLRRRASRARRVVMASSSAAHARMTMQASARRVLRVAASLVQMLGMQRARTAATASSRTTRAKLPAKLANRVDLV